MPHACFAPDPPVVISCVTWCVVEPKDTDMFIIIIDAPASLWKKKVYQNFEVILAFHSMPIGFSKIQLDLTGPKMYLDLIDQNKEN